MICQLDDNDFCARHQCHHRGPVREIALDTSDRGQRYRAIWDANAIRRGVNPYIPPPKPLNNCVHFDDRSTGLVTCPTCRGNVQLKTFRCEVYGQCTIAKKVEGIACCNGCKSYNTSLPNGLKELPTYKYQWAYCVTTVPSRINSHLPRTLASLTAAGFDRPWLFVDGAGGDYSKFDVAGVTVRSTPVKVHGNWVLSLYETYIRNPLADRFAVFQDDVMVVKNLRKLLDDADYPAKGYWNCYTYPGNQEHLGDRKGWNLSNQRGMGALALVFDRSTALTLLRADHMLLRPMPATDTDRLALQQGALYRGQHAVDGGIVTALAQAGVKEYVHNPSLVQHTGLVSSFSGITHPIATSFPGEVVI